MSEASEIAQLLQEVKALRENQAAQDNEMANLRAQLQELKQVQPATPTNLANATILPTSRRKLLKAGVLAAGLAVTGAAATVMEPHSAEASNGQSITVANSFTPSTYNSAPTRLYNSDPSNLSPVLFQVDNTLNNPTTLPVAPVAIAGTASDAGAQSGIGVYASANNGYAVFANIVSGNGIAINAQGGTNYAIKAQSSGVSIYSFGSTYGASMDGNKASLWLMPRNDPPPSRLDSHLRGEILFDRNGSAWVCVVTGTPGTWRKIGGPDSAGSFHALQSIVRMVDTRPGHTPAIPASLTYSSTGGSSTSYMTAGEIRTYDLNVLNSPVPAAATAISAVVTAVNPNMPSGQTGYFQFWSGSTASLPSGSQVNYNVPNVANSSFFITSLTPNPTPDTFNIFTFRDTDIIIDIVGYYL